MHTHTHAHTHTLTLPLRYDATGDQADLKKYHPIAAAVVEAFRQRFPNKDKTTGKIDMFPSQALETYQCPNPEDRKNCGTNPSTDIAGLMAVLPRLIATANVLGVPQSQVTTNPNPKP